MQGCEEYFDDLAEAEAVKLACMNADGLAVQVITEHLAAVTDRVTDSPASGPSA